MCFVVIVPPKYWVSPPNPPRDFQSFLANPSDVVKPDWDFSGLAQHAKVFLAIGYRIAQADKMPEWKPGNEFRAIREKSLGK